MNDQATVEENESMGSDVQTKTSNIHIALFSLHGLIRADELELGRDADTGGQTKYVLELAAELAKQPNIGRVDLITAPNCGSQCRRFLCSAGGKDLSQANIVRIPFGPKRYLKKESLWPYLEVLYRPDDQLFHANRSA